MNARIICYHFFSEKDIKHIRLIGGHAPNEGRLEIQYKDKWGTVCDKEFSLTSASVACMQLGYGNGASAIRQSAVFGEGDGEIWLEGVACTGRELSLFGCPVTPTRSHTCGHDDDIGIICRGNYRLLKTKKTECWLIMSLFLYTYRVLSLVSFHIIWYF